MTHTVFGTSEVVRGRECFPRWMMHEDFVWFLDKYVMKLGVGGTIDTDFHTIERIA